MAMSILTMSAWMFPIVALAKATTVAENLYVWVYGNETSNAYMKKIIISEKGPQYQCTVNIIHKRDSKPMNFMTFGFSRKNDATVGYSFVRGSRPHWECHGTVANNAKLNAVWNAMKPYLKRKGVSDAATGSSSAGRPRLGKEEYFIGGVGLGCTLEYVESVYGEPEDKEYRDFSEFAGRGYMQVTYIYSPTFSVKAWGRTSDGEEEWGVSGFSCKDSSKTTPSGFHVGMPYTAVTQKYAPGKKKTNRRDGRTYYDHGLMLFYVDHKNIITEIVFFVDI